MDVQDSSIIFKFPNELVIHIFQYIPERWSLSLVCKHFYEVVCTIEKNSQKILLNDEKFVSITSNLFSFGF